MRVTIVMFGFVLGLSGCLDLGGPGAGSSANEQDVGGTQYVELSDFAGIDQGAWFDLVGRLGQAFTAQCGDTFCEGDFANLTPLSLGCSVTSKLGNVHDCAWTFGGAASAVDPTTAAIAIDAPTFACHVKPKTTATKLVALLQASADPLHEPLPGTTSLYDALGDCFADPIGATPITVATSASPTYVAASDYYVTAANQAKWSAAQAALVGGFNNICGDTFCGSDYSDLQALDLTCAITKSTGNVKGCTWTFAGSFSLPAASGALSVTTKSFRCPVTVKGTLAQLIATLTASDPTTDPIQRALPGVTTSAYDALGGCLP